MDRSQGQCGIVFFFCFMRMNSELDALLKGKPVSEEGQVLEIGAVEC